MKVRNSLFIIVLLVSLVVSACEKQKSVPTSTTMLISTLIPTYTSTPIPSIEPTSTFTTSPTISPTSAPTNTPVPTDVPEFGNPFIAYSQFDGKDFSLYSSKLDETPFLTFLLAQEDGAAVLPVWSPDALSIVYLFFERQTQNSYFKLMDNTTGQTRLISEQPIQLSSPYCWTHDSIHLVWSAPQANGSEMDIYKMTVESGEITNLTEKSPVWDAFPACSPVDNRIAFVSDRAEGGKDLDNIWVMDIDGENLEQLTQSSNWENKFPSWSPDGSEITFYRTGISASGDGGPEGLWSVKADGSGERLITELEGLFLTDLVPPVWSPSAEWIAYKMGLNESADIYIVPAVGGEPLPVSDLPGSDDDVSWSASSNYLTFTHSEGEVYQIYIYQLGQKTPRPLFPQANNFLAVFGPEISP